MTRVGIITDSVACVPVDKTKEYDISIVPFVLHLDGKSYLDQREITPEEFWKMFNDIKEVTTGAPAQGIFIEEFRKMSKNTDSIACVFLSKALSALPESAAQARDIFIKENPGINIEIVDSRTACGAEGFAALEMAKAAQKGKNLQEVVQIGQDISLRSKCIFGMETLKYLIKGGRAPKTAYVGEMLGIKPIVGFVNNTGVVDNIGKARGLHGCMQKLVDMVGTYSKPNKPLHINVHYTNDLEKGRELQKLINEKYHCVENYFTPFTPVMCGHTGPVISVSFYSED